MKNLTVLFIFILTLSFIYFFIGCNCQADCTEDRKVPEDFLQLFPFQTDDEVQYVSDSGDTLTFSCFNREFSIITRPEEGEGPQECCENYLVEDLKLVFQTTEKDSLILRTDNYFFYSFACSIKINDSKEFGYWPLQFYAPVAEKLDSIQIAGKIFYNIYPALDGKQIYLEPTSLGIVGFFLDGKEWRLL